MVTLAFQGIQVQVVSQDFLDQAYLVIQAQAVSQVIADSLAKSVQQAQVALADIRALVALESLGIVVIQALAFQAILGTLARSVHLVFLVTLVR